MKLQAFFVAALMAATFTGQANALFAFPHVCSVADPPSWCEDRDRERPSFDRPSRSQPEPDEDDDKGHGNDDDGHDDDNPGKGKGHGKH